MASRKTRSFLIFVFLALMVGLAPHGLALAAESGGGSASQPGTTVNPLTLPAASALGPEAAMQAPRYLSPEVIRLKKQHLQASADVAAPSQPGVEQDNGVLPPGFPGINAPTLRQNFIGIAYTGWTPPDPIMAVGPTQVVVMVNSSFAIYNKVNGSRLYQNTLGNWFANVQPGTTFIFDPKCTYDRWGQRFIMVALAKNETGQPDASFFLISVSKTNSATGGWWNWKLNARLNGNTNTNNWADYPQLGFDSGSQTYGGIYLTANMFLFGGGFQYTKVRVLRKAQLYAGAALIWHDFWNLLNPNASKVFTLQPVHTYSAATGEYLVNTEGSGAGSGVIRWRILNPTGVPSLTRLGRTAVRAYSAPPDAVQRGSATRIDTMDCRLINAVYQGGYIYAATAEAFNFGGGAMESAVRYFKINASTGAAALDITYGNTDLFYYFPAIAVDAANHIYLVFTRSGATEYAGIRFTGRKTTDAATQASANLKFGEGPYVRLHSDGRNRWGDYSGIARDFTLGDVWIYGEYAKTGNVWGTWIGRTRFF